MGSERLGLIPREMDNSSLASEGDDLSFAESTGGSASLGALQESLRAAEERVALVREELDRVQRRLY